jgi:O-antigen ligase
MSISRSAMLALGVEFVVLFVSWQPTRRAAALIVAPIFVIALRVMSPGLVGTIFTQFANAGDDPSLQGRADSRGAVGHVIAQSPWVGRGFNTYIPADFVKLGLTGVNHGSLDNQYLGSIVEVGYVGLAALIGILVIALGIARGIRLRAQDDDARALGQSFLASFLAVAVGMATFDGLGFPMFAGLFFLLFGIAGAMWRVTRDEWREAREAEVTQPRATVPVRS